MKYIMIETTPQDDQERRFIPIIFPKELLKPSPLRKRRIKS